MGVILLALIAYGSVAPVARCRSGWSWPVPPRIALGTYVGGWRIIRTLGKGLVEIESPQGMARGVVLGPR